LALPQDVVWELRSTGTEAAGGGYAASLAGASSTDFSQQDAVALSVSDGVGTGTTNLSSVTGGFLSSHVGNIIRISGGTLTAGFYAITARVDTNNVTLDRTPGTGTGSTVAVGGASKVGSNDIIFKNAVVSGNIIYCKGTFTIATNSVTCLTASSAVAPCQFIGYTTTRTDNGRCTFTLSGTVSFRVTGNFWVIKNVDVNANGSSATAISQEGTNNYLYNCIGRSATSSNYTDIGGSGGGGNVADACEFKSGTGDGVTVGTSGSNQWSGRVERCTIHGNSGSGISCTNGNWTIERNFIYGNTLDGVTITTRYGHYLMNNVISRNGRDGVRISSTDTAGKLYGTHIRRNIFNRNTGYQVNYTPADISTTQGATVWANHFTDCNSFYTTGTGVVNQIPTLANSLTLTSDPFVASSTGDYTIDSGSAGGAAILATFCSVTLPDSNAIQQVSGPYGVPSSSSLTSIRSRWRELTNERSSTVVPDATVDQWLQVGAESTNRRLGYHFTTDSTSIVFQSGVQEYSLPSGTGEIVFVELNGKLLSKRDMDAWQRDGEDWRNEETGTPSEWCHYGNTIIFRPAPDANAVAVSPSPIVRYVSRPASVTTSGFAQLSPSNYEIPTLFAAAQWFVCYPDAATSFEKAKALFDLFEKEAAMVKEEYRNRLIAR
jgi:hypothetical protein